MASRKAERSSSRACARPFRQHKACVSYTSEETTNEGVFEDVTAPTNRIAVGVARAVAPEEAARFLRAHSLTSPPWAICGGSLGERVKDRMRLREMRLMLNSWSTLVKGQSAVEGFAATL